MTQTAFAPDLLALELTGDAREVLEQLGAPEALPTISLAASALTLEAVRDEATLRRFLAGYREQVLLPVELPAILAAHASQPIDLLVNMHNTETAEYLDTMVDDAAGQAKLQRLFTRLVAETSFDPSRKLGIVTAPGNTTNVLWKERRVPIALMEQRVGPSAKLGRLPTVADRLAFGRQLIVQMAETVLGPE